MRESVYLRCRDRNVGVEQIRQPNSVRFRGKAQQRTVGIKRIGAARLDELELHLLASDNQPLVYAAVDTEDDVERVGAELRDLDDFREARWGETAKAGARIDVFKQGHERISALPDGLASN